MREAPSLRDADRPEPAEAERRARDRVTGVVMRLNTVFPPHQQVPRHTGGGEFGAAIAQILGLCAAASATALLSGWIVLPSAAVWAYSLWWGGREI